MDPDHVILISSFFIIALIYSSVGFGGGSSYLALLALAGIHFEVIRPAALMCNIVVVSGGTYIFWKQGKLDLRKSLPFISASIPFAFIGGMWKIEEPAFFILLGTCLILASVLLWFQPVSLKGYRAQNPIVNGSLGAGIGFLSGLVSIGGGIFLSPVLHLLNWDKPQKISALASLFILVNSISGLAGQITRSDDIDWSFITPLFVAVFIGGQIGSRLGAKRFDPVYVKRITAAVILVAAINILRDHL